MSYFVKMRWDLGILISRMRTERLLEIIFDKNLPNWNDRAAPLPIENRKFFPA